MLDSMHRSGLGSALLGGPRSSKGSNQMQREVTSDILLRAAREDEDAVQHAVDVDPLIWRTYPPLPLPPVPPMLEV